MAYANFYSKVAISLELSCMAAPACMGALGMVIWLRVQKNGNAELEQLTNPLPPT